jgi:hypothetical protein
MTKLKIVNGRQQSPTGDQDMPATRVRAERLQIMLSPEELTVLDDFRFKRRMPSRAAAVRELLRRGLSAEGFAMAADGARSSEFGVTGKTPAARR